MTAPLVYMVLLYWHPRELPLVERCVRSLLSQDTGQELFDSRVLVIDNGCGMTPSLPSAPGRLELLRLARNLGFAGGHNAGLRHALANGADYVFLVNSDVVAETGCLRELVTVGERSPHVGFLGPLVLRELDPDRIESSGQAFNVWTGRHRELSRGASVHSVDLAPRPVTAVSGCALLARRQVIEAVGLFDERLFFYFEDMDWCLRAGRAGFDVLVVPTARVWHLGSGSVGPASPRTTYYSVRNHMIVAARHASRATAGVVPVLTLAYHLAFLACSRERRTPRHVQALVRGAWDAWRGHTGEQRISASRHQRARG